MSLKKILLSVVLIPLLFACNTNQPKPHPEESTVGVTDTLESDSIVTEEKVMNDIGIGGEGVYFENGGMCFSIEGLERTAKQAKEQYDALVASSKGSEEQKKRAIESMELNQLLFQGVFCCTTHEGKHCADSKKLRPLQEQYGCDRFMKRE